MKEEDEKVVEYKRQKATVDFDKKKEEAREEVKEETEIVKEEKEVQKKDMG